jgi:polyisoprenoid-binding protein YceI
MKNSLFLALPVLFAAPYFFAGDSSTTTVPVLVPTESVKPAAFKLDTSHSWILFKVNHLGLGTAWGSFGKFDGSFSLDSEKASESSVSLTIDAGSVSTNNKKRDDHLKGPDFFNSREFPSITFTSTKVEGDGKDFTITGTLELLGKKKDVVVKMNKVGEGNDPWGNYRAGFEGSFKVNRHDFGMDYMKDGLGAEVTVTLAFEGTRE